MGKTHRPSRCDEADCDVVTMDSAADVFLAMKEVARTASDSEPIPQHDACQFVVGQALLAGMKFDREICASLSSRTADQMKEPMC